MNAQFYSHLEMEKKNTQTKIDIPVAKLQDVQSNRQPNNVAIRFSGVGKIFNRQLALTAPTFFPF